MSEELSDFPAAFQTPDVMPWEMPTDGIRWPWGRHAGRPLREFASRELIYMRRHVVRRNGAGSYFQKLLDEIDAILTERGGEL